MVISAISSASMSQRHARQHRPGMVRIDPRLPRHIRPVAISRRSGQILGMPFGGSVRLCRQCGREPWEPGSRGARRSQRRNLRYRFVELEARSTQWTGSAPLGRNGRRPVAETRAYEGADPRRSGARHSPGIGGAALSPRQLVEKGPRRYSLSTSRPPSTPDG